MFCPKCGDELQEVNGELACARGGMALSKSIERRLVEAYVVKCRVPSESQAKFRWGGSWFCPGCGVSAKESEGRVRCPQCLLSMNEFLYELIQVHPHA